MSMVTAYKGEVAKVFQLAHVVNTILYKAEEEDVNISPMKLQKLLYFIYMQYYSRTGTPLFAERFEPWEYGPVVSDVYYAYKNKKGPYIENYMRDAEGKLKRLALNAEPDLDQAFNTAWLKYKGFSGIELSQITHKEDGAWWKAAKNGRPFLSDEDIRSDFLSAGSEAV